MLGVNNGEQASIEVPKKLYMHPPSARRIQLPDGRHIAYEEKGVSAEMARLSLIAPHSFLSSRLAGSLLQYLCSEFNPYIPMAFPRTTSFHCFLDRNTWH